MFFKKSPTLFILSACSLSVLLFSGCSIQSYEFENNSNVYKSGKRLPCKVYLAPSPEIEGKAVRLYDIDYKKGSLLRQNLAKKYPDLFTVSKSDSTINIEYMDRRIERESKSGGVSKFFSIITLGFLPYVSESKYLYRMEFTLPDKTNIHYRFYRKLKNRGSLGLLAIFQLFRLHDDLKISKQDPYDDPVFLSIFADGVSSCGDSILIKAFNSDSKTAIEFLEEK